MPADDGRRERPLGDTLARARRAMPGLGIARVADITRMDRLGLPVCMSVRPRGRVLRVHAGKGLVPAAAEVGALMEAVEHAVAEPQRHAAAHLRTTSVARLEAAWGGRFHFIDLCPRLDAGLRPRDRMAVVDAEDLAAPAGSSAVPLPAERVYFPWDPSDDPAWPAHRPSPFAGGTGTGLAAGNTVAEASVAALLEVLERHVVALHEAAPRSRPWPEAAWPASVRTLAARWRASGLRLAVRTVPNEFGLPCAGAALHEPDAPAVDLTGGWALDPDPAAAVVRAVTEAAQSRLSMIHGGRDDAPAYLARHALPVAERNARLDSELARWFGVEDGDDRQGSGVEPPVAADIASARTNEDRLRALVGRVVDAGFPCVLRRVLVPDAGPPPVPDLHGLHVVRIVVPGCEDVEHPRVRMGPRLLARVLGETA